MPSEPQGNVDTDVLVIGGGIAGMSAAMGASERGLRVTVVERDQRLGGRAMSWTDDVTGDPVHIGPHVFMSEYPNIFSLLDRCGTRDKIVWQDDHFLTVMHGRDPVRMKASKLPAPLQFVPSLFRDPTMRSADILSTLPVTLYAMQMTEDDVMRLDSMNAYAFLRRMGVTRAHIDSFWSFTSMAIMNVPLEVCSAGALLRFYKRLLGQRDYYFGFADGGLGDLFAPAGKRFIEERGGEVLLGQEVCEISVDDNGAATGAVLRDGKRIRARHTVAALPPGALRQISRDEWFNEHTTFRDLVHFHPSRYVSVFLWFDRKLTDMRMWARAHRAHDLNCDFYDLSNIHSGWRGRPSVVASNIIFCERAAHMSDDAIIEATRREIVENLASAEDARITHAVVNHIPMAIHCPFPGTERRRPPWRSPVRNLFLAGDWIKTGLPSCMESAAYAGFRVAEEVLAERGVEHHLAIEHDRIEGFTAVVDAMARHSPMRRARKLLRAARRRAYGGLIGGEVAT